MPEQSSSIPAATRRQRVAANIVGSGTALALLGFVASFRVGMGQVVPHSATAIATNAGAGLLALITGARLRELFGPRYFASSVQPDVAYDSPEAALAGSFRALELPTSLERREETISRHRSLTGSIAGSIRLWITRDGVIVGDEAGPTRRKIRVQAKDITPQTADTVAARVIQEFNAPLPQAETTVSTGIATRTTVPTVLDLG